MIIDYVDNVSVDYILDRLSEKNIQELEIIYGGDFKNIVRCEILSNVCSSNMNVVKLDDNTPVAITGLLPINDDTAALFFLHTEDLQLLPKLQFIKKSIKKMKKWRKLYNQTFIASIYKENTSVIKWVSLLGFKRITDDITPDFKMFELTK